MDSSPAKRAKTSSPPPPDMSALHAPTARGWGKSEWTKWSATVEEQTPSYGEDFDKFEAYINARNEAIQWAAPDKITVKISIIEEETKENHNEKAVAAATTEPDVNVGGANYTKSHEIVICQSNGDTFRSILDKYCKEMNIERDDYSWNHKGKSTPSYRLDNTLLNQTDVECFFEFWHCHPPTLISRFVNETTFLPEIVGRRKVSPGPKPSVAPSFVKLKDMPPDGNASSEEWDKWHRNNSMGCMDFWMEKSKAVQYSCPDEIDIVFKGLSHEHTVKANAWEALSGPLSSYCESTTGTDYAVSPSEVILRSYGDDPTYIDAQTTSPRMRFEGYSPLKMEVVYRDTNRTEAELESIRGPIPVGYQQFLGSGYRLSDTEQPWLVTIEHGIDMYNKIGKEALMIFGGTDYKPGYDPVTSWFKMTGKVKSVLGSIVRKPRDGWSAESVAKALDGLTAALINLTYNDDWSRDALGKIVFANPDCRKESVAVLRKMDNCAVAVINAANEFTTSPPDIPAQAGGFGIERGLGQLKRLMGKYKEEYSGFSQDDYDYRGHEPFSKALPLIN